MTSEAPTPEVPALGLDTPLWLRLWSWSHVGSSVPVPGPVPEMSGDPWPVLPAEPEEPQERLAGHDGPWIRLRGGSTRTSVYHSRSRVLRVSKSPDHHHVVDIEALSLTALVGEPVPALIAKGAGWLLRGSVTGDCPMEDGPWVEETAEFAARLRLRDLSFLPVATYPKLKALGELCGQDGLEALLKTTPYPPVAANQAPTHGDLHAKNVLVNSEGHLVAVLDFESISLAPLERDTAIWISVLAGQMGVDAMRRAAHTLSADPDPVVLRAELIRLMELAARRTLGIAERERTVRALVSGLVDDPELPIRVLTQ